mgnify:CR=1 FL=1
MTHEGLPWPNSAGYWSSGGQQYFARAKELAYEVRDCRNFDVACYYTYQEFKDKKLSSDIFPWFPCTLTIHDGRDEQMNYPPGPYVLLENVKKAIYNFPPAYRAVINNIPKYNPPDTQAEKLLTEICQDAIQSICEDYSTCNWISKLNNWWRTHKPKSEREQKLEKIILAMKGGGIVEDVANRVLEALEQ